MSQQKEHLSIVIASDSYKGSLSSFEVAELMTEGFNRLSKDLNIKSFSIADGGEGTVEALAKENGEIIEFEVTGLFGEKTIGELGKLDDKTCVLETASPCGLNRLKDDQLDPYKATSRGIGEMIVHALDMGFENIYIGLGGSAVNDGGIGLAQALGASLTDINNNDVPYGIDGLKCVANIDTSLLDSRIKNTNFILLSDVTNPLIGINGATFVYGPQKGVPTSELEDIDRYMENYGKLLSKDTGKDIINTTSAGAAGGIGATLIALTNAKIERGIEAIIDLLNIEKFIEKADIVFTGEGRIDGQSINGKAPVGIAKIAKKYNKPVVAIVGSKGEGYENVLDHGIDLVIDLVNQPITLDECIASTPVTLPTTSYMVLKLFDSIIE
ncbi:glycerate kinase family protein [Anaerococcus provencensis]|uniref:glycerate kinase family protein n=1 Tax=Anaerococcus provencensis TaxID=938293 RepID=UPI0003194D91|nr:glycerate kinase [Anaerococcus provencensis]